MSRKRTARQQTMGGGKIGEGSAGRLRPRAGLPVRASSAGASCRSPGQCGGAKWILLAIGALLVLGSVRALAGGAGPDAGLPREGSPAPSLKAKTLDGDRLSLADLRGKVVLVNFWATWCPPCRAEMPSMMALARELSAKYPGKFEMVAVSVPALSAVRMTERPPWMSRPFLIWVPGGQKSHTARATSATTAASEM